MNKFLFFDIFSFSLLIIIQVLRIMSRLSYQQLEVELQSGVDDDQLKRIQAKYGIAAKRQLQNRVSFSQLLV